MNIKFKKSVVLKVLISLVAILLLGNFVVNFLRIYNSDFQKNWIRTAYKAFDLNTEGNLPSLFSSLLLLVNAILLFIISRYKKIKFSRLWTFLAIVFTFLFLDEILHIHEHLVIPMRNMFNTSGFLYFAWVIPYGFFVVLVAVFCYNLLFHYLPKKTRNLFIFSGILFISGAIGMELLGANHAEAYGENYRRSSLTYFFMYSIEETLEMLGSCLFCYALLDYIHSTIKKVELQF